MSIKIETKKQAFYAIRALRFWSVFKNEADVIRSHLKCGKYIHLIFIYLL